jgi:hypothetical protein
LKKCEQIEKKKEKKEKGKLIGACNDQGKSMNYSCAITPKRLVNLELF